MPRTKDQIRTDLDAAQALDRILKIQTPEFKANRQRMGKLIDELVATMPRVNTKFTVSDYQSWPDSFEQSAINREEQSTQAVLEYSEERMAA